MRQQSQDKRADTEHQRNPCSASRHPIQRIERRSGVRTGKRQDRPGEARDLSASGSQGSDLLSQVIQEVFRPLQVPGDRFGIRGHLAKLDLDSARFAVWHGEFAKGCVSRR
jgi:hypothetical protein